MKIAVTSKSFSKNEYLLKKLQETFPHAEIKTQTLPRGLTQEELVEFLQEIDAAIVGLEKINEEVLKLCPKLRVVSKFGVGLDNIDKAACEKFNVKVGWTGGVNKRSVSEMALGFMLGLSRNLFTSSFHLKGGNWVKDGGFQLTGKNVGIIGLGNIGKDLASLLKPFGCQIFANDVIDISEFCAANEIRVTDKDMIFDQCDFITVHTPLTNETRDLFSKITFASMKKRPFIINTARGGIVNETDLIEALDNGQISGAALDTFVAEPLCIDELYKHPRIVTTPHIGGNAKEAVLAMGLSSVENLQRALS